MIAGGHAAVISQTLCFCRYLDGVNFTVGYIKTGQNVKAKSSEESVFVYFSFYVYTYRLRFICLSKAIDSESKNILGIFILTSF